MTDAPPPESLVVWSDDQLLVIDKPAGLPALPDGYNPDNPHVMSVLAPQFGRLWIVHRLDRGTSGIMALARTAPAHRHLNMQFDRHTVRKTYAALVGGDPPWDETTVRLPLRSDGDRKHRTVIDHRRGKPAVTHLAVLERLGSCALVEARPETGRTHQIRAHLAALALPLLADELYGGSATPLIARTALHAASLSLAHPVTEAPLTFEAPYPADFALALQQLRTRRK